MVTRLIALLLVLGIATGCAGAPEDDPSWKEGPSFWGDQDGTGLDRSAIEEREKSEGKKRKTIFWVVNSNVLEDDKYSQSFVNGPVVFINLGEEAEKMSKEPGDFWLHITTDRGKTWQAPVEVELVGTGLVYDTSGYLGPEGEGIVGISVVVNEGQPATLPNGTAPDREIVVDRRPPELQIFLPEESTIPATGALLSWEAKDANLDRKSVSLQYSIDGGKSWVTIVRDAPAKGNYRWKPPAAASGDAVQFRGLARDRAGNRRVGFASGTRAVQGG